MSEDSEAMQRFTKWIIFWVVAGTLVALFFLWIGPAFIYAQGRSEVAHAKVDNSVNQNSQGYVAMQYQAMEQKMTAYLNLDTEISDLKSQGVSDQDQQVVDRVSLQKYYLNDIRKRAAQTPAAVTSDIAGFLKTHPLTTPAPAAS